MINPAQFCLLESFVGTEGILTNSILENDYFDLGTKVLYLKRAISKDRHSFLLALDKLYIDDADDKIRASRIDFIRVLKQVNDLCFNNEIKLDESREEKALFYTFKQLGEVIPHEFHLAIVKIIESRIEELLKKFSSNISIQRVQRRLDEKSIKGDPKWRYIIDLPLEQRSSPQENFGIFRPRKTSDYQINDDQEKFLLAQHIIIKDISVPIVKLLGITDRNFHEGMQILHRIGSLIFFGHFAIEDIFNLQMNLIINLVNFVDDVIFLIVETGIPFSELKALDEETRKIFLKYSHSTHDLIKNQNISFEKLLKLNTSDLKRILRNPDLHDQDIFVDDSSTSPTP